MKVCKQGLTAIPHALENLIILCIVSGILFYSYKLPWACVFFKIALFALDPLDVHNPLSGGTGTGAAARPLRSRVYQFTRLSRNQSDSSPIFFKPAWQSTPLRHHRESPGLRNHVKHRPNKQIKADEGEMRQASPWLPVPTAGTKGCAAAFTGPGCNGRRVLPYFGESMDSVARCATSPLKRT